VVLFTNFVRRTRIWFHNWTQTWNCSDRVLRREYTQLIFLVPNLTFTTVL